MAPPSCQLLLEAWVSGLYHHFAKVANHKGSASSNLAASAMKIEVIDLYKEKYKSAYIVHNNKDGRLRVMLIPKSKTDKRKGMLYARYIWENHYGQIGEGLQIDHINGDKTDDRLENLQVISQRYNTIKDHRRRVMIERVCPVCHTKFLFPLRNLSTHPNPCCSRKCGSVKGHWNK